MKEKKNPFHSDTKKKKKKNTHYIWSTRSTSPRTHFSRVYYMSHRQQPLLFRQLNDPSLCLHLLCCSSPGCKEISSNFYPNIRDSGSKLKSLSSFYLICWRIWLISNDWLSKWAIERFNQYQLLIWCHIVLSEQKVVNPPWPSVLIAAFINKPLTGPQSPVKLLYSRRNFSLRVSWNQWEWSQSTGSAIGMGCRGKDAGSMSWPGCWSMQA